MFRKPITGDEIEGKLTGPPRTIKGVVVIDIEDSHGKTWTSPTANRMAELIVQALGRRPLGKGCRVWWLCEGTRKSYRGLPHFEFSIKFMDEAGKVFFKHIVLDDERLRRLVAAGRITLDEALGDLSGPKA